MKIDLKESFRKNTLFWMLIGICLLNFVVHLCFYPALPDIIPIHWDANGVVDGQGPKAMALLLSALPAVFPVLFRVLPSIDPKAENFAKFRPIWRGFTIGMTVFFCVLSWLTELTVFGILPQDGNKMGLFIGLAIGLLFIILGNYMPRIKQNYSFGCKTPWALADEHNWNRTQRMGGIVFIVLGVAMMLGALFSSLLGSLYIPIFLIVTVGGCAWIYIYSFLVFKKIMK